MLRAESEFPHPGAPAFVRHTGEAVRIIQHDRGGETLVGRAVTANAQHQASDNFRLPRADLFATRREAVQVPAELPRRRRRAGR